MFAFRSIVILLLLASCTSRIEKEQLIGRYTWNDGRTDTLEVRADGTYEYWRFKPGVRLANSGTWKLNAEGNEVEFQRENFPFLTDHVAEGSWFSRVRASRSDVCLLYAANDDIYLTKVKAE
jgi:hypothetical protein